MSRLLVTLFLLLFVLTFNACAVPPQDDDKVAQAALAHYYPKIKMEQLNPTPLAGIYELVVVSGETLYFAPASGHMFLGDLWTADGHNLTRENATTRLSAKTAMFPLELAIVIGEGKNQVIEVTDPDCPFCRQSSDYFAGRDDITRYIYLYPIDQLHPQAAAKSRYILAAKDQEQAYEEVFSGKYDGQLPPHGEDNGLLQQHRKIVQQVGINGTPHFWINGQYVSGYNPATFKLLLNK